MSSHARLSIAIVAATLAAGCAGARLDITAEKSRFPISMSQFVRDPTGRVLDLRSLESVGTFKAEFTGVGLLYSAVTIPGTFDISDEVNTQVAAVGGEAIVNATVVTEGSCQALNAFPFLNALPIWPGCVPVTVRGNIVRRRLLRPPLLAPPPPPPFPAPPPPPRIP